MLWLALICLVVSMVMAFDGDTYWTPFKKKAIGGMAVFGVLVLVIGGGIY